MGWGASAVTAPTWSDTRRARMLALAEAHDEWVAGRMADADGVFNPEGRIPGSDYNLHVADLELDDDGFHERALQAVSGGRVAAAVPPPDYVDTAVLVSEHEQAVADAAEEWPAQAETLVAEVVAGIAAALAAGMLLGLLALPPSIPGGLTAWLSGRMLRLASGAARAAAVEAAAAGMAAPDAGGLGEAVEARIGQAASAAVTALVAGYTAGAAREAARLAGPDTDPDMVAGQVRQHLVELGEPKPGGLVAGNLTQAMSAAQAEGRLAVFRRLPVDTKYRATEVNDRNRCPACAAVDGTVYNTLAEALADYPTTLRYMLCAGGGRCRGLIYPLPEAASDAPNS